ncbi:hypothetical protein PHYBLDRAFT_139393 [Phycomyces blakesleeanus NRRL 1555(-)]|uniref:Uncharacterized protein n=1 Tax=Phycomyces blakesleeanus (strain ATCC 8743b / DSM 1359 / FGSC 10004 / NBRC 33097 / NRRL 1555) TaxID=763407 RepID=A0A163BB29_PHYB8|nr:hypothetical protein PHYBLDRAFT_139393 [Phycomyces blakesleeanus NRRL 1555(-)]OAD79361.1 hypothetical protein PHYBLDRAFT_139393 [Phycomyces blakesleeanus NRRL 1555(-)]|eukprot:XP_018297401.1 hypothetical protein PHYBLDRAFT_139393 [Phycomyces blakesleeanus NRRL 1555(-)]
MIEPAIQTSCKAFDNGCVIDSALNQNCVREAHNIRLQIQVDENCNIGQSYSLIYKDFFGKVVVFFEHKLNNKRWLLALVQIYVIHETNGIPVVTNVLTKPKIVHLVDVKELIGLVMSTATNGQHQTVGLFGSLVQQLAMTGGTVLVDIDINGESTR